jgi:hypothetical protein
MTQLQVETALKMKRAALKYLQDQMGDNPPQSSISRAIVLTRQIKELEVDQIIMAK